MNVDQYTRLSGNGRGSWQDTDPLTHLVLVARGKWWTRAPGFDPSPNDFQYMGIM